jgi:beta-xylosidase
MQAVDEFNTTLTLCFTPEHLGLTPHYTSPPKDPDDFAAFARKMIARYAPVPTVQTQPSGVTEGITYAQME